MEKTIKLFEQDPYQKEFTGKVLKVTEGKGGCRVILDCSAFYPEGGGQRGDRGWLGQWQVIETVEKEDVIMHSLSLRPAQDPPETGIELDGKIDWQFRYKNMQNHTGEHLVSGIIHERFGYDNVGFHMGHEAITIDFNGPLTWEQLLEVEKEANDAIEAGISLQIHYPDKEHLAGMEYRSKKEIEGQVRIVEVPGFDRCACCGTHVRNLQEVRLVKIISMQNYKGGARVAMLSGRDAIEDYGKKHEQIAQISRMLSAKPEETAVFVERLKKDQEQLKLKLTSYGREWIAAKASAISEDTRKICIVEEEMDKILHREFVNLLCERADIVLVLNRAGGEYAYILASFSEDVREAGKLLNQAFQGKGGGSPRMVQGKINGDAEKISAFFKEKIF